MTTHGSLLTSIYLLLNVSFADAMVAAEHSVPKSACDLDGADPVCCKLNMSECGDDPNLNCRFISDASKSVVTPDGSYGACVYSLGPYMCPFGKLGDWDHPCWDTLSGYFRWGFGAEGQTVEKTQTKQALQLLQERRETVAKTSTKAEWEDRQHKVRAKLKNDAFWPIGDLLEQMPTAEAREIQSPLKIKYTKPPYRDERGFSVFTLTFESFAKFPVTAVLLLPDSQQDGNSSKVPAVLF